MPESSQSSFIPKRGATQKLRQTPRRYNIFVLSVISYALFVAAPVASAAVFVYKIYNERQVTAAAEALQGEIATFKAADFESVLEFDKRLLAAEALLNSHISVEKALLILERATAQSIGIGDLNIKRTDTNTLTATANLTTDSFNAALFQRGTYTLEDQIASTSLRDVKFTPAGEVSEDTALGSSDAVSFGATFVFDADEILYSPQTEPITLPPANTIEILSSEPADDATEEVDDSDAGSTTGGSNGSNPDSL